MKIEADRAADPAAKTRLAKTAERLEQECRRVMTTSRRADEGRKQLRAKAQAAEHKRDLALARYHHYEVASAAFQIGIVLASAEVITGMIALAYFSGLLGVAGLAFTAIGLWAPHAVHLF